MDLKKMIMPLICCSMFGLVACGGDDSSTSAPASGEDQESSSSVAKDDDSEKKEEESSTVGVPETADKSKADALYKAWKRAYIVKMSDEKKAYPDLGSQFGEIFSKDYTSLGDPARVLWQTSTNSKCIIDEAEGTPMYKRGCTVSEGIGYGMMISALMEDWDTFRGLWIYSKAYRESQYAGHKKDQPGLMPWLTSTFDWTIPDASSATDADLDIATSLVIAYKKTNKEEYLKDAKKLMKALWNDEINQSNYLIYSGDTPMWHVDDPAYNLCYFSPVAIRLFAEVDPDHKWNKVLDAMYTYMKKVQDGGTGVFPDWSNTAGVAVAPGNGNDNAGKTYWTFNKEAVRIPWRIAWDYMWYQDERAEGILKKLNDFIVKKSGGDVKAIPAVNYSWDPKKEDIKASKLPTQWLAAWCATGVASNEKWTGDCLKLLNKEEVSGTPGNYFTDILLMTYSQLLNGYYKKP